MVRTLTSTFFAGFGLLAVLASPFVSRSFGDNIWLVLVGIALILFAVQVEIRYNTRVQRDNGELLKYMVSRMKDEKSL